MKKNIYVMIFILMFACVNWNLVASSFEDEAAIREMAEEKVKEELHKALEEKLGTDIDVETYLDALNKLANGEFAEAKSLAKEKAMAEFMDLCVGPTGAGVISAAWEFDKWVWNSVQTWADEKHEKLFYDEFLKSRIERWQREGRFSKQQDGFDHEFKQNMEEDFEIWMQKNHNLVVSLKLRVNKEKFFQDFRDSMWNEILRSIYDLKSSYKIRKTAWEAKRRLEQKIEKYKAQFRNKPVSTKSSGTQSDLDLTEEESKVVAEFLSLWETSLRKIYQGEKLTIKYAAQKVGKNQFRCAYEAQSSRGDNIRSIEILKNDIKNMKQYLGINK